MRSSIFTLLFTLLLAVAAAAELPSASAPAISQALSAGRPTIIDLGARTCIPCKKMAPILENLATELQGKASVLFIDVRADQAAARKFGVQMIPTQIFFDASGKEVKRHVGGMERDDILNELKASGLK